MRFLQAIVSGIVAFFVLVFGLLVAALVAAGALVVLLVSRLRLRGPGANPRPGEIARRKMQPDGDAIEVSATEVSTK